MRTNVVNSSMPPEAATSSVVIRRPPPRRRFNRCNEDLPQNEPLGLPRVGPRAAGRRVSSRKSYTERPALAVCDVKGFVEPRHFVDDIVTEEDILRCRVETDR